MAQSIIGPAFKNYSRRDEALILRIAAFLRKQGRLVWVDREKLEPGTPS